MTAVITHRDRRQQERRAYALDDAGQVIAAQLVVAEQELGGRRTEALPRADRRRVPQRQVGPENAEEQEDREQAGTEQAEPVATSDAPRGTACSSVTCRTSSRRSADRSAHKPRRRAC